jgi:hypothetical protein
VRKDATVVAEVEKEKRGKRRERRGKRKGRR